MSNEHDRLKHSRRLHKDHVAINKQKKIAKSHGFPIGPEHRLSKIHATTCGDPNCAMCGNPRKFFKERTIQERRFDQDMDSNTDHKSNGLDKPNLIDH